MSGDYANAWLKAGEQVRILEARCAHLQDANDRLLSKKARLQQALTLLVEHTAADTLTFEQAREIAREALAGPDTPDHTLNADLAPLLPSECPNCGRLHPGHDFNASPGPVQDELSRLREEVKFCPYCAGAFVPETKGYEGPCPGCQRAEAAEARCARLQQALKARHRWLADALSRNQIVHETDRARARAFIADWEALAGPDTPAASSIIGAAEAERARLQQALAFYADEANWRTASGVQWLGSPLRAFQDKGGRAREALAGLDTPAAVPLETVLDNERRFPDDRTLNPAEPWHGKPAGSQEGKT